jgi:hypothetical protein
MKKREYKVGDTVRLLKDVRMGWRAAAYGKGFLVQVTAVNDNGTLALSRDDVRGAPAATCTVLLRDVEPAYRVVGGTYYSSRTPLSVIKVLEEARQDRRVIRLHYGDRKTGRDWLEEHDVVGRLGRSMGPVKIPLLLAPGADGGCGLLDDGIVKIRTLGATLYKHRKYHTGKITIRSIGAAELAKFPDSKDYTTAIDVDGENHANFRTMDDALLWLRGMGLYVKTMTGPFSGEVACVA